MGLSNRKEQQLRKMPKIETVLQKSKDGRYVIHRTVITNIKPVEYYEAILDEIPKQKLSRRQQILQDGYELAV
jgi:hypothetical protein